MPKVTFGEDKIRQARLAFSRHGFDVVVSLAGSASTIDYLTPQAQHAAKLLGLLRFGPGKSTMHTVEHYLQDDMVQALRDAIPTIKIGAQRWTDGKPTHYVTYQNALEQSA